jgi:hypothetical protein
LRILVKRGAGFIGSNLSVLDKLTHAGRLAHGDYKR